MHEPSDSQKLKSQPPAIIIGLDSMQGLQAARILARRQVPVVGIAAKRKSAYCKTRVCREILIAPTTDSALIDHLLQLASRLKERAVLFPCEDNCVQLVSRYRKQLQEHFHVLLPDENIVDTLMDKVSFYEFAKDKGYPLPATHVVENRTELKTIAEQVRYPVVLKPRDSAAKRWENETIYKAFKVHDEQSLLDTHQKYQQWTDCFIVQEWIEGDDSDLYSCNCYFNAESKPLATFIARKLRQWPPETGISCLGEEVRNDDVLEQTIRLFSDVNYRGLGYMEMKRDRRDGKMYIVEPNIGRPTGRSAIAEAGGVELLYTAYCDAVGWPLPEERQQTYHGVKWIHVRKDLQSAFRYWRQGKLTLREWWRSTRGKKAYALATWRDPLPFVFDWFAAASMILSPNRRKKRKKAQRGEPARLQREHG